MNKTVDAFEAQREFQHILDEVAEQHVPYVVLRGDRPGAAIIPYEQFVTLHSGEEIRRRFDRIWAEIGEKNAHFSEEEIEADVVAAIQEVRQNRAR